MASRATVADLDAWLATAAPGDAFTYFSGTVLPKSAEIVDAIRELHDQGEALLVRVASGPASKIDRIFHYRAVRTAEPMPPRFTFAAMESFVAPEKARGRVLRLLKRRANFRQPAPGNAEIAAMTGVSELRVIAIISDLVKWRQIAFTVGEGKLRTPYVPTVKPARGKDAVAA